MLQRQSRLLPSGLSCLSTLPLTEWISALSLPGQQLLPQLDECSCKGIVVKFPPVFVVECCRAGHKGLCLPRRNGSRGACMYPVDPTGRSAAVESCGFQLWHACEMLHESCNFARRSHPHCRIHRVAAFVSCSRMLLAIESRSEASCTIFVHFKNTD